MSRGPSVVLHDSDYSDYYEKRTTQPSRRSVLMTRLPLASRSTLTFCRFASLDAYSSSSSLNIAFVCPPLSGHMIPLLHIADAVVKRGHRVRVRSMA